MSSATSVGSGDARPAGGQVLHDREPRGRRGQAPSSPRASSDGQPLPGGCGVPSQLLPDEPPAVEPDRRSLPRPGDRRGSRCSTAMSGIARSPPFMTRRRGTHPTAVAPRSRARTTSPSSSQRRRRVPLVLLDHGERRDRSGAVEAVLARRRRCTRHPRSATATASPPCHDRSHGVRSDRARRQGRGLPGGLVQQLHASARSDRTSPPRSGAIVSEIAPSRRVIVIGPTFGSRGAAATSAFVYGVDADRRARGPRARARVPRPARAR